MRIQGLKSMISGSDFFWAQTGSNPPLKKQNFIFPPGEIPNYAPERRVTLNYGPTVSLYLIIIYIYKVVISVCLFVRS